MSAATVYNAGDTPSALPPIPSGPGQTSTLDTLPMTGLSIGWIIFLVIVFGALALLATLGARGNR